MEVTRLSKRSSSEQITEQIREMIRVGKLEPGDKLPSTKALAERFDVGRSTMREALSALKAMGLIDIRQGEGCTVRQKEAEIDLDLESLLVNRTILLELIEARRALEISNAGIAALKRTDADLQQFQSILARMGEQLGDESAGEHADVDFHLTLARATHNAVMVRLFETISAQLAMFIQKTRRIYLYADKTVSERLWREHRDIYQAVLDGDAAQAQHNMRVHLQHVEEILIRFLRTE